MKYALAFVAILGACGDDAGALPDAPMADAQSDAPIDDAPASVVKVTVIDGVTPVDGAVVHFLDADSTVVATTDTDAAGVATATMLAGGSVTVVNPFPLVSGGVSVALKTIVGVKPGDDLKITRDPSGSVGITVVLPPDASAPSFAVETTCGDENLDTATGPVTLRPCATTDILGETIDDNLAVAKWVFKTGVAITAGATIDLGAETYAPGVSVTTAYALPSASSLVDATASRTGFTPRGQLFECGGTVTIAATSLSSAHHCPNPAGVTTVDWIDLYFPTSTHTVFDPSATSHDLTTALLHDITTRPAVATGTRTLAWTESTTGTAPELVEARVFGIANGSGFQWDIVAPYTPGSVTYPQLPGSDAVYNLDTVDVTGQFLLLSKFAVSYDVARPLLFVPRTYATPGLLGRAASVYYSDNNGPVQLRAVR